MLRNDTLAILQHAGIDSLDALAEAAADFVRCHPLLDVAPIYNGLSEAEEEFLVQGGALGIGAVLKEGAVLKASAESMEGAVSKGGGTLSKSGATDNLTRVAAEYAAMVSQADTLKRVLDRLGVGSSRIRQRIQERSLYTLEAAEGRVFPRFQFDNDHTIPNLEIVLQHISKKAHPVAVQRFFTSPHPDLESDMVAGAMSPRDWLVSGHPVEPVMRLAQEL